MMATLKENLDLWVCEVLELFNSLLQLKVVTEDEQTPLKTTEMEFKMGLKIITNK